MKEPRAIRVLAIDPSVTQTGLCFPDRSTCVVNLPKGVTGVARLMYLREYMREIVSSTAADVVVIEDYAIGNSKGGSIISTCEWGGVLRLLLHEMGVWWLVASPQAIKIYVTGSSNAKKELLVSVLSAKTGITFGTTDEADAYGLAALANHHFGSVPWIKVPKANAERALTSLNWPHKKEDSDVKNKPRKGAKSGR